jgi:hypothetical protein
MFRKSQYHGMSAGNQQNQWIASAGKHRTKFYVANSMIHWNKRLVMKGSKGPRNYRSNPQARPKTGTG